MFFYKSEEIDNNQRINLNVKNKLVSEILNEITKNNNLTYKITGKHIIITKLSSENQDLKKITGRIKDNSGEPIVGVNVVEKGTTNGAITDINGNFSIEVVTGAVLQISYIGYNTQDIKITDKTSYNIVLKEDVEADIYEYRLRKGDIILMCTDGLSNMVEDEDMFDIVKGARDIVEAVHMLIEKANSNGGRDNIGVVMAEPLADEVSVW